jgi:nitrogen fixation protein FixH
MTTVAKVPGLELASRGWFWAAVPAVLLAASMAGVGTLAAIAARDPGFALEENYYERAVKWDRIEEQRLANERLGYRLSLTLEPGPGGVEVVVRPTDRDGVALNTAEIRVVAFANARAADRRRLSLRPASDGSFRGALADARPGLWEFRCDLQVGGEHFTQVMRADVSTGRAP